MNSRYDDGKKVWINVPGKGNVQVVLLGPAYWNNYPYSQHAVVQSDRIELLAFQTYGDCRKYWMIAEMNPGLIMHPDDLASGDIINIPQNVV